MWRHTCWKNWVNCTVLRGNSAGLRTVLSSRLSHRKLRISLKGSHSFLTLPADTTMTSPHPFLGIHSADELRMKYSFSNTTSYSIFYAFFSSFRIILWSMWLANRRTALFLSTIVTRTRRHTKLTKKTDKPDGNLCCAREYSVQFFVQFFLHS